MKFQFSNGDSPLPGYVIKRGVGTGGFGEVYFAETDSGKEVALKRIQRNHEIEVRGVRQCLNLRHPNLVAIYDIRVDERQQGWIVMEFISGESLKERIEREGAHAKTTDTFELFAQLAAGVHYLHEQGIVHRDLKPANVFIENGLVKIGDYGLSKYISVSRRGGHTESVGTFHYMAPEVGKGVYGQEVDIYALGVILFEMLSGDLPFDGESTQEIIMKHLTQEPDLSAISPAYRNVVAKALAKDPDKRFRNCRELLAALGWEIDGSGLARLSPQGPKRVPPAGNANDHNPTIPVARIISAPANPPVGGAYQSNQFVSGVQRGNLYQEPIARTFQQAVWRVRDFFADNGPEVTWPAGIVAAVLLLTFLSSGGFVLLALMLIAYPAYYVCYLIVRPIMVTAPAVGFANAGSHPTPMHAMHPGMTIPPVLSPKCTVDANSNVSTKLSWRAEQIERIRTATPMEKSLRLLKAFTRSGGFIAAAATAMLVFAYSKFDSDYVDWTSGVLWVAVMATLMTWGILVFGQMFELKKGGNFSKRLSLLAFGAFIGLASFWLANVLQIDWGSAFSEWEISQKLSRFGPRFRLSSFLDETGAPVLMAHVAFFAGLLWIVRWWKQASFFRRNRFRVRFLVWSMVAALLVQMLIPFPTAFALVLAGVTSLAVQFASPTRQPEESCRTLCRN